MSPTCSQTQPRTLGRFCLAPSPPSADIERQVVQNEVQQLTQSINSLGKQQREALAAVEAMQKSPLRNWNGKYDAAVAQVQQTATLLEGAMPSTAFSLPSRSISRNQLN